MEGRGVFGKIGHMVDCIAVNYRLHNRYITELLIVTGHFLLADFLYVKTKFLIRVTKCFLK